MLWEVNFWVLVCDGGIYMVPLWMCEIHIHREIDRRREYLDDLKNYVNEVWNLWGKCERRDKRGRTLKKGDENAFSQMVSSWEIVCSHLALFSLHFSSITAPTTECAILLCSSNILLLSTATFHLPGFPRRIQNSHCSSVSLWVFGSLNFLLFPPFPIIKLFIFSWWWLVFVISY